MKNSPQTFWVLSVKHNIHFLPTESTSTFKTTYILFQLSLDAFWEEFLQHLKFSLIVYKREPAVERTIEFVSRFATSVAEKDDKVSCKVLGLQNNPSPCMY